MSETISVRSVLGRFLEHSRFFVFEADTSRRYFLGSADLLTRNLDHRIEVVVPVEARSLQTELDAAFDALMGDNVQAWELQPDATWTRVTPKKASGGAPHSVLMNRARARARRQAGDTE